jgi:YidC/Oxa1 family membrane protein insertase
MGQQFYVIRNNPAPGTPAAAAKAERDAHKAARKGHPVETPEPEAIAEEPPKPAPRQQPKKQPRSKRKKNRSTGPEMKRAGQPDEDADASRHRTGTAPAPRPCTT